MRTERTVGDRSWLPRGGQLGEPGWSSRHRLVRWVLAAHVVLLPLYAIAQHERSWQAWSGIVVVGGAAVVSWLIAFDVINLRNRTAYGAVRFLDQVTRPILAPLRRIIPSIGGLDITPVILIIVITAAQRTLIPAL